jgi:SAM-dependent methyltransferase
MTVTPAGPIDAFAPAPGGVYRDGLVEVRRAGPVRSRRVLHMVRTEHFDVVPVGERVRVAHLLSSDQVGDDLAGLLAEELFRPGWLRGQELFQRIFTGVVRTVHEDPLASWDLFYRNTLNRIDDCLVGAEPAAGSVAAFAPVHGHVSALVRGSRVLELGCCFGFLSLRLAAAGLDVTASDVNPGTIDVLARVAPRLGVSLRAVVADATCHPGADGEADTVLAVHLLEHLDPDDCERVVSEAVRLARRRVVIAVPLEEQAEEIWGHLRTVSLADLTGWGRHSGLAHEVYEYHGGWLVLDRS